MTKNAVTFLSLLLPFSLSTLACATTTPVEIVQSIPERTALAQPDLAYAKDLWPQMIARANATLDIAQMYVSSESGRAMEPVLQALEAAGNRGVKIRFLLWKGMLENDKPSVARIKAIPNLEFAIYDISKVTGGILHAKYWIVDNQEIFVGSQNADWRALEEIHETGVDIRSAPIAERLRAVFEYDWKFATTGKWVQPAVPTSTLPTDVELVSSPERLNPKGVATALPKLLSLLKNAKTSVKVQLLDYSTTAYSATGPWLEIDQALRDAGKRGVKVQLLVSHWNTAKSEVQPIKDLSLAKNVEVRICFMPDLPTGHIDYARVIHTKHMVVDGSTYWVGTSNWSRGYFYDTRDIEIVMNRPDLAAVGNRIFETVWNANYTQPIDPKRDYPEPRK